MKILFTGKPNKGSWQIRAVQMAAGFAHCIPHATEAQCRKFDFIVAVKRVPEEVIRSIRASGRPWAWDVVDAYPQPQCSAWGREEALTWLREKIRVLQPTAICWPNEKMKADAGVGGTVIPHHARPGIACNPVRERIEFVGYEGCADYLGEWEPALHAAAQRIGAKFCSRAPSLAECDVVVAVRGGAADCYATRQWKSNVKLANAHASGTPFIGQPDPGYKETACGQEQWIEQPRELDLALEMLAPRVERQRISIAFRSAAIRVKTCQQQWQRIAESFS